jgi:hypothetical protein
MCIAQQGQLQHYHCVSWFTLLWITGNLVVPSTLPAWTYACQPSAHIAAKLLALWRSYTDLDIEVARQESFAVDAARVCFCFAPAIHASAGVCGDPYQHYSASNFASLASLPIQATYTQGQIITVEWVIAANHGGRIGLKVCPTGRTGLTQACFDAPGRQLQR